MYAAQFSKGPNGELIAAGGSGSNEAKVFNHDNGNKVLYSVRLSIQRTSIDSLLHSQLVGTIAGLSRGVFSLDFSPQGDKMVVAGADAAIRIVDVYDYSPGEKGRERPITPSIR